MNDPIGPPTPVGLSNAHSEPSPRWTPGGRLIGFDLGGRRIGIAVSDEHGLIASPVGYVQRGRGEQRDLADLLQRWSPVRLIVGLPISLSGREGPQAADVRALTGTLLAPLGLPISYVDERLTTTIAERILVSHGTRRDARREKVDAMAAAVILQSYLDTERDRFARRR